MAGPAESRSHDAIAAILRAAGCVYADDEATLLVEAAGSAAELSSMTERRVEGMPLEQVLGWAEFCGRRFRVEPGVFVPRRRTELLVDQAVVRLFPGAVLVDLCCGSGAVGAAIAAVCAVQLHATDIDPAAVRCARRNVGDRGRVVRGDLYDSLPRRLHGSVAMLVANAPYVPTDEIATMPAEARLHEGMLALDGGADGLGLQRRVAAESPRWLAPGGHLLIETSRSQAERTLAIVGDVGLHAEIVTSADLDATVVVGTRRA